MNKIKDKLKTVSLSDIKPYKNNAKIHSEQQIEAIKKSIERNEYIQPICVDKKNIIVIGHCRYEALKRIDSDIEIEVIDLSNLSSKEIKKLRILDNKIISDDWNIEKLQNEIDFIYKDNKNDIDDLDNIINDLKIDLDKEILIEPKEERLIPYNKIHFLISFHPDKFNEIKKYISKIKTIEGIEIEQGTN